MHSAIADQIRSTLEFFAMAEPVSAERVAARRRLEIFYHGSRSYIHGPFNPIKEMPVEPSYHVREDAILLRVRRRRKRVAHRPRFRRPRK